MVRLLFAQELWMLKYEEIDLKNLCRKENSDTTEESDEEEEETDEASLMMEEAMELDDLEVDIAPMAVNNKPSTSTGFQLPLITLNEESQEEADEDDTKD